MCECLLRSLQHMILYIPLLQKAARLRHIRSGILTKQSKSCFECAEWLLARTHHCMLTKQIAAHSCKDGGHLVPVNAPSHLWAQHRPPQRLLHCQSDRVRRDGGHYGSLHTCLLPYTSITPSVPCIEFIITIGMTMIKIMIVIYQLSIICSFKLVFS